MYYFYGNDSLVVFEEDPYEKLSVGQIWTEGERGKRWGWSMLPGLGTASSVAWSGEYDFVSEDQVDEFKRIVEKTRAERRKELAEK